MVQSVGVQFHNITFAFLQKKKLQHSKDRPLGYFWSFRADFHIFPYNSRAYRSLGVYYYFRKDYQGCVDNLKKSLELNAYQMKVYLRLGESLYYILLIIKVLMYFIFPLGYAALQIELWAVAADAYRKYCAYESDNFEAWNNLSNAYLKQGDKLRAFRVLGEAIKCDYGNWKIWENILIVAMDLRQLKDVIGNHFFS